ncbi:ABC transporter substrate-binding protein [Anaerosphaera multitolerans]|uniref:ABC transporter substrate-binding protein n=1 Tax=Anaerosphaera multitolerans TaxID=2487351 RepID=A0A437S9L0_9FIRM|nr:MqnA/MqnD/SBP family protein [Anaerosphaera multitolerans]RVU55534.1 ABC transporter substrate-binding protein [Anaerosphaera multitolerans]
MNRKKISVLLMSMLLILLTACGNKEEVVEKSVEPTSISIGALKGPTAMGLVKLFNDSDKGVEQGNNYKYKIAASPDEIVAGLSKGEFDVAAIPANLASILYNKTEGKLLKVSNLNTLGVLYIASKEDIDTLEDLKSKTVIMSGKGSTPEFAFKEILLKKGIDPERDLKIEYRSQHEEVLAELIKDDSVVALLPQPFLTVAETKVEGLKVNFSLNDLWEDFSGEPLITGVLVVRNEFLEENKENFDLFLEEYKASVDFVNENIEEAAVLVGNYDIVPEEVAKIAIPKCNIVYVEGDELKAALTTYLEVLSQSDKASVGGELPDENFYYKR